MTVLRYPRRAAAVLGLAVALGLLAGCGGHGDRLPVHGSVTFNGKPVDGGAIAFLPEAGDPKAVQAVGQIQDGKYELSADRGPAPGKYKVAIFWNKKTGRQVMSNDPPHKIDETTQVIPKKYNEQTVLTVEVQPGQTDFDFTLKSN